MKESGPSFLSPLSSSSSQSFSRVYVFVYSLLWPPADCKWNCVLFFTALSTSSSLSCPLFEPLSNTFLAVSWLDCACINCGCCFAFCFLSFFLRGWSCTIADVDAGNYPSSLLHLSIPLSFDPSPHWFRQQHVEISSGSAPRHQTTAKHHAARLQGFNCFIVHFCFLFFYMFVQIISSSQIWNIWII